MSMIWIMPRTMYVLSRAQSAFSLKTQKKKKKKKNAHTTPCTAHLSHYAMIVTFGLMEILSQG